MQKEMVEMDKDLQSRQEAREAVRKAFAAQKLLSKMEQAHLDRIVCAIAVAFADSARELALLAVEETGFGNVKDKTEKNRFASQTLWQAIKNQKVVGLLEQSDKLWQVGVPMGVIAGIIPSTNPTSTLCYKAMIALKAGNAIVFSPHPKALRSSLRAWKIVSDAATAAGAPEGSIGCLALGSMAGCKELLACPEVSLILATGGPAMVRAAYSSGKPAIGVGAGNGPSYIHQSADVEQALSCILRSKTFDNGTVCASEQSIIVEKKLEQAVVSAAKEKGFYFMDDAQAETLGKLLFRGDALNPQVVGRTALELAEMAGFCVPQDTKILVGREQKVGLDRPYSMEKLCPVLAFYVMEDEDSVLKQVVQILSHEGSGHTFSIHAKDESVIRKFALEVPVSRFLVNTPAALGGIGASTKLFPALTLGCGAVGGSSSSNNISPMDLVNIRRVAWDCTEKSPQQSDDLVELLTQRILQRLQ